MNLCIKMKQLFLLAIAALCMTSCQAKSGDSLPRKKKTAKVEQSSAMSADFKDAVLVTIDGDTLKIETDWLYTLNNEYKYELNQRDGVLTLTDEDDTFRFIMTKKKDGGEKDSEKVENSKEENSEE